MTSEHLRQTRDAAPFRPFTINMTDGRSYRIPHRDSLSLMPNGRIAIVIRTDSDAFEVLDIMLMSGLSVEASSTPPSSSTDANGT